MCACVIVDVGAAAADSSSAAMRPFSVSVSLAQAPTSAFIHIDGIRSLSLSFSVSLTLVRLLRLTSVNRKLSVCVSSFHVYGLPDEYKKTAYASFQSLSFFGVSLSTIIQFVE